MYVTETIKIFLNLLVTSLFLSRSQRSTPEGNEAAILSVMKSKGKKTMKSQNHINKNTGGDVRKNNRINNINTQCPKGKSISPERHSPARETDQQIQPALTSITTACGWC